MPDLFGLDIAGIVKDAIGSAGGLLSVTLHKRVPGTRNPVDLAAGIVPTFTAYVCEGVISDYSNREIDGTLIQTGDRQVLILASGLAVDPAPDDRVTVEGKTYQLVSVSRDPARAAFTCVARGRP